MPTHCDDQPIDFTPLGGRAVVAAFDGGRITSDAGALLLREVAAKLDLFARTSAAVPDPRDPDRVEHEQRHLLAQRVLRIACGWEDLNDHHGLRVDALVQMAAGRGADDDRPLASPATLCRLENRVGRGACVALVDRGRRDGQGQRPGRQRQRRRRQIGQRRVGGRLVQPLQLGPDLGREPAPAAAPASYRATIRWWTGIGIGVMGSKLPSRARSRYMNLENALRIWPGTRSRFNRAKPASEGTPEDPGLRAYPQSL